MAKQDPRKIAEELKKQNDDSYGDDYVDGDPDKFKNTHEMLEDAVGNAPLDGVPYSIDDEIDGDEEGLEKSPLEDFDTDDELKDLDAEDILKDDNADAVSLVDLVDDDDNFDDYEE